VEDRVRSSEYKLPAVKGRLLGWFTLAGNWCIIEVNVKAGKNWLKIED
jgi:hypothetical protein